MMEQPFDPLDEALQLHVAQLMEHFDSVRIVCTSHVEGSTALYTYGGGNIYAQEGSVKDWVIRMNAIEDERSRNRGEPVDDDDEDDEDGDDELPTPP